MRILENEEKGTKTEKREQEESLGFPGGPGVKNPPCNAGNTGSIPGLGRPHMPWSN